MCAINGFTFEDQEKIVAMNTVTQHRGPDDTGFYCAPGISLGSDRLAIIDLTPAAHQPMTTPDNRYTIVYNGEMYNFEELRAKYIEKGFSFRSQSDTEVVLTVFVAEGPACLKSFNGIFAFAIWDAVEQKLFLARDHFGVKPLYYSIHENVLYFSSEAKALFVHSLPRSLNLHAMNSYFRFLYVAGPETMWEGIYKLQPGSYATFSHGNFEITRYYEVPCSDMINDKEEAKELIVAYVREAVRKQLISDRPVGLFLSGGIDSNIICALMSQESNDRVKTFSIGFESDLEQEKYNVDATLAAQSAKFYKTDHHAMTMNGKDAMKQFENCVIAMDEPVSNHIQVATYLLAHEATKKVKVVLGGDGGDEIFGGYDRYYYYSLYSQMKKYFPFLSSSSRRRGSSSVHAFTQNFLNRFSFLQKLFAESPIALFFSFMSQKETSVARFIKPAFNNGFTAINTFSKYFSKMDDDLVHHMMKTDIATWLPDESLIRSDKLTMAHGLEQRVPFLDPDLVACAFRIPSHYKLQSRHIGKKILRDAFRDVLPPAVFEARKRGFFSPASKWIRSDMKQFVEDVLQPSYCEATRALFDWEAISGIVQNHMEYKSYELNTIWSLLTFQVWAKNYLD